MNFDRLGTFLAAADEGNFTHAGRRLCLSQSAVSQQIRELEHELGISLFERRGRGLLLTPAGERLRDLVRPLLRDVHRIRTDMDVFRGVTQGVLRVGASPLPGVYLLPHALGEFSQAYPNVATTLVVGEVDETVARLQNGEIDLAVVEDVPEQAALFGYERLPFLEDEIRIITPPGHRWARRGYARLEELPEEAYIFRLPGSPVRTLVAERLAEMGVDPHRLPARFELGNTEGIKHAVMAGLGVGFISRYATRIELEAGLLAEVPIEGLRFRRTLWKLLPPASRMGPHRQAFCDLLDAPHWLPANKARAALGEPVKP
jgi:DNA-binding transcriptional LysR family regulator